ncbi:MAG: chorismate synthase [Verrucomicrobiota bacterium]|nr:chorismate synthase [Verrucomicrobiota bacterium]
MSSSFGKLFVLTTFGESHGPYVGAVVDGCPAGLSLSECDIQPQLDRRRPGQGPLSSPRSEQDVAAIVAGVEGGITLGGPVTVLVRNQDARPGGYADLAKAPRPSHADFTYKTKYGVVASSGGGRAGARETVARVAGGAIAEKFLTTRHGIRIVAWVSAVGGVEAPDLAGADPAREAVDNNEARCPDSSAATRMTEAIEAARAAGDSVGGVITAVCRNVPAGWGEPVFEKAHAALGAAMLSIPAARGFEIGAGFSGARQRGSEHNDAFVLKGGRLGAATNRSGGVQGGITNGEPIVFRVAFKPPASIAAAQRTADYEGRAVEIRVRGRHDPCVVPRAVPIVEAMAALVLADLALMAR